MSGPWLVSYLALWITNIAMAVLLLGVIRQIGVLHLKTVRAGDVAAPVPGPTIGSQVPAFEAKDVETGRRISSAELLGRTSLLLFITPTCHLCQDLAPVVDELAEARGEMNFLFISQGGRYRNREFVRLYQVRTAVLTDPKAEISDRYEINDTPTLLLVDANAIVLRKIIRATPDDLRDVVASLRANREHGVRTEEPVPAG